MRKKKGVSPLIAVVLLVAFSVAMAAFVSTYVIKKTKEFKPESFTEDSGLCDSVTLAYDTIKDETTGVSKLSLEKISDYFIIHNLQLKNKGSFTINKLTITAPGKQSQEYNIPRGDEITPSGSPKDSYDGLKGIAFLFTDITSFKKSPNIKIIPWTKNPEKADGDPEQNVICTKKVLYINPIELCNTVARSIGRTLPTPDEDGEIQRRCQNLQWSNS